MGSFLETYNDSILTIPNNVIIIELPHKTRLLGTVRILRKVLDF